MNVQDTMRRIVEAESDAIRNIPYSPEFDKAVELIMELEKEFGVTIPDSDAEKIQTVGDAVAYIENASK